MLEPIAPEELRWDVPTYPFKYASVYGFCSSVHIFAVLLSSLLGSLQTSLQLASAHRCLHTRDLHPLDNQSIFPSGIQTRHTGRTHRRFVGMCSTRPLGKTYRVVHISTNPLSVWGLAEAHGVFRVVMTYTHIGDRPNFIQRFKEIGIEYVFSIQPLKLSMYAFCAGLSGWMYCSSMPKRHITTQALSWWTPDRSLSIRILSGLQRYSMTCSSTRITA